MKASVLVYMASCSSAAAPNFTTVRSETYFLGPPKSISLNATTSFYYSGIIPILDAYYYSQNYSSIMFTGLEQSTHLSHMHNKECAMGIDLHVSILTIQQWAILDCLKKRLFATFFFLLVSYTALRLTVTSLRCMIALKKIFSLLLNLLKP